MVQKLLLQLSTQELDNSMVIPPKEGGPKEARYEENNIITSDYMLRKIISPRINKISATYKVMCGYECWIFAKSMHSYLLSWNNCYLKNLKTKSTMRKAEDMLKWPILYLRHIIIMWCRMGGICINQHLKCIWKKYGNIHHPNMH